MYADCFLSNIGFVNKIIDTNYSTYSGRNLEFLQEEEEYVQLAEFPGYETFTNEEELMDTWAAFMDFRDNVLKALEEVVILN